MVGTYIEAKGGIKIRTTWLSRIPRRSMNIRYVSGRDVFEHKRGGSRRGSASL
jgi:hypothetical protein